MHKSVLNCLKKCLILEKIFLLGNVNFLLINVLKSTFFKKYKPLVTYSQK